MAVVSRRGLALLLVLLGVCSVSAASALQSDGLNQKSQDFNSGSVHHRSLLQAPVSPTPPPVSAPTPPPVSAPSPPPVIAPSPPPVIAPSPPPVIAPSPPPVRAPSPPPVRAPSPPPVRAPSPPPVVAPAPPTPVRTYLMWIGIGACGVVVASVAVFCLCRKFGQNKIRGGQRLPPLPRYH